MVTYTCEECGKKFHGKPSKRRRFCGKDCLLSYSKRYIRCRKNDADVLRVAKCRNCGTPFRRRYASQRYCSPECYQAYIKKHGLRRQRLPVSDEELKRLYEEEEVSTIELGERFGVSHTKVYRELKRIGAKLRGGGARSERAKRKLSDAKISVIIPKEDLKLLYEEGLSLRDIAAFFGCSMQTISRRLVRYGIPLRRKEEVNENRRRALQRRPNKAEQKLMDHLREWDLPYQFVGDGSLQIQGRSPDFMCIGKSKLIELLGRVWHQDKRLIDERVSLFKAYGFETLIVWEEELEDAHNLHKKILFFTFGANGMG